MQTTTAIKDEPMSTANIRRTAAAATIGNILEIYDFIVFGIFAIPISKVFFPADISPLNALIFTWMAFAAGSFARPVGALILGRYADRVGRKKSLSLTLMMMAIGTLVPAVCPNYMAIGIAAPIIMVLGRLIQGFSAGGEIGGVVAVLVENAPENKKYFYASLQQAAQGAGVLLAGLVGLVLNLVYTEQGILDGGWRWAFVLGLLIGPVGFYLRRNMEETVDFKKSVAPIHARTFLQQIVRNRNALLLGLAVMIFWTVTTYISNYFTTYGINELHLSPRETFLGQVCYALVMIIMCPAIGILADNIGPFKPMVAGALLLAVCATPVFWVLTHYPSLTMLVGAQMLIAMFLACYAACASTMLSKLFPTRFRATGVGFSYAVGVAVFGGLTPVILTSLIGFTGSKMVVAYYMAGAAVISCIGLMIVSRNYGNVQDDEDAVDKVDSAATN